MDAMSDRGNGAGSKARQRVRRDFTREFKAEAVRLMQDRRAAGVSLAQVGRDLEVHPDRLRAWARELAAASESSAERRPGETPEQEVRRLRRELVVLRQERDFAKKAAVYFAKESR